MLINIHFDVNIGKIKEYLYLEGIFCFCNRKKSENLGFSLTLKTADLQDIIYTSMTDDINVTIKNLSLFLPIPIPSNEPQLMFIEATQNTYKISYDEYFTERRVKLDLIVQHYIGSAQNRIVLKN